ncbi:hypothetical protein M9Y10_034968 [Tritrichomonas musculus]|uniref:Uncharacterized protein n=1 Tax=Tritrichomonas musculus TaxID=1915356 RepID=A0ABR2KGD2_9EUKA
MSGKPQKIQKLESVKRNEDAEDLASKLEDDIKEFENSFRSINKEKSNYTPSASTNNHVDLQKKFDEVHNNYSQQQQQFSDFTKSIEQRIQKIENNTKLSNDANEKNDAKINELEGKINHASQQLKSVIDMLHNQNLAPSIKERNANLAENDYSSEEKSAKDEDEKTKEEEEDEDENIEEKKSHFFPFSIESALLLFIVILELIQYAKFSFRKN